MAMSSDPAARQPGDIEQGHKRLAAYCLVASGICFTLFPAIRPFFDESVVKNAGIYASPLWWISHSFGMAGFVLLALGILGLYLTLTRTAAGHLLWWAVLVDWVGTGLTLAFFGAEAFSLPVIGRAAATQNSSDTLTLINEVRFGPGIIFVLVGLLLIGVAAITVARAVWVSERLPKWAGVPIAVGMAIYIPILQGGEVFQSLRIIDGLVTLAGAVWILWGLQASHAAPGHMSESGGSGLHPKG